MEDNIFIEKVFEIAFGDNAFNKGYSPNEVLERLQDFSNKALIAEDLSE